MRVLIILLFFKVFSFGQSKKEKIIILTNRVDSLNFEIKKITNKIDSVKNQSIEKIKLQQQERINNLNSFKTQKNNLESEIINLKFLNKNNEERKNQIINEINNINGSIRYINNEIENLNLKIQISKYNTVLINNQEWMEEDIKTTIYNDGSSIFEANSAVEWENYGKNQLGCFRKLKNGTFLYNGYAVLNTKGILPTGYVLPSLNQFNELISFLGGGNSNDGDATKSLVSYPIFLEEWVGNQKDGWLEFKEIKTNGKSGFNARKGGSVDELGSSGEGNCSYWWTSTIDADNLIVVDIGYCSQYMGGGNGPYNLKFGFAVRGIKK